MKKKSFILIMLGFTFLNLSAQNFILTFNSVTPENNIDSIRAINAVTKKTAFVEGSNRININSFITKTNLLPTNFEQIDVYPNPFTNKTELRFYSDQTEQIKVSLTDMNGRTIIEKRQNITRGLHRFTISIKNEGLYILSITGNHKKFCRKIISQKNNSTLSRIEYNGYSSTTEREKSAKIDNTDLIVFYVYSGDNITKIADSPTESKTYDVEFYECKDADGNSYPIVKVGSQWWMAENLKATKYQNGDSIPNVIDDEIWRTLKTSAYCNFNNDESFANTYGKLYNWYAADDSRKVAPEGWHIPSDEEWSILTNNLGGELVAGGKLKETGTTHWLAPNSNATDSIGFRALPGGFRNPGWGAINNPDSGGDFTQIGEEGHWHSSTEYDDRSVNRRYLRYDNSQIGKWDPYPKESGFSIRCIKD